MYFEKDRIDSFIVVNSTQTILNKSTQRVKIPLKKDSKILPFLHLPPLET